VQVATNTAPTATNDSAEAQAGSPVTINALSNDSDPENDPLSIISVGAAQHGNATIMQPGGIAIVYTSVPGFNGSDTFSYTISDGKGGTATATVTVTVSTTPTPPAITSLRPRIIDRSIRPQSSESLANLTGASFTFVSDRRRRRADDAREPPPCCRLPPRSMAGNALLMATTPWVVRRLCHCCQHAHGH
jgi:hypothetical protein